MRIARSGTQLAHQRLGELELARAHEAVEPQHLARADGRSETSAKAPLRPGPAPPAHRRRRGAGQRHLALERLLELLVAPADHLLDQPVLVDAAASSVAMRRLLRNTVTRSETSSTSSRKCEMKMKLVPSRLEPAQHGEQLLDLGRRQGRGRLVQDDDPRPAEQHPAQLDQLLQPERQPAALGRRVDIDARGRCRCALASRAIARQRTTPAPWSAGGRGTRSRPRSGTGRSTAPGGPCRCRRPARRGRSGNAPAARRCASRLHSRHARRR